MKPAPVPIPCLPEERKPLCVLLEESDPYSAAMIRRMLAVDGRLRCAAPGERADLRLCSVESDLAFDGLEHYLRLPVGAPPVLLMSSRLDGRLTGLLERGAAGYVLKNEIACSLAWALLLAWQGYLVLTPGVQAGLAGPLPRQALVCSAPGAPPVGGQAERLFRQVLAPALLPGQAAGAAVYSPFYRAATSPRLADPRGWG